MTRQALFDANALAIVRRAYARQVIAGVGVDGDLRLEQAFAETPREAFLGPGPWKITKGVGYQTVSSDPALVYQDVLIALKPERQINNGLPSLHARWLHEARINANESVVHIGIGAGYYTALLSRLVGSRGHVTAIEFDADLAASARQNLADLPNVNVIQGDGADWPREPCDLIYVNFAIDRPAPLWIEQLKPGGRLVFPLGTIARAGVGRSYGVGLCITRVGGESVFAARSLGNAYFIRAEGERLLATGLEREALLRAFETSGFESVKSLRWRVPPSADKACYIGADWSLGYDEP